MLVENLGLPLLLPMVECEVLRVIEEAFLSGIRKSPILEMKSNRATIAAPTNPAEGNVRSLFERMSRQIGRVAKDATPENVHHFRTNTRRVEALVEQLAPEGESQSKLLRQLSKLRKRAGKLRDLDVQISFLKELKVPDRQNHRAQLLEQLAEEKVKRTKKLAALFNGASVRKLRNRLRKVNAQMNLAGVDPLKIAFARLPRPASANLNEKELHACRIAAKRARYLAELSNAPAAKLFIEELKRAQDAVGEWHDVLKLSERAEKLFGSVRDSALVAVLQNIMRARFRRAGSSLLDSLRAVEALQRQSATAQKLPASVTEPARVVAA